MKIIITKKEADEKILKTYNLPKDTIVEILQENQILGANPTQSYENQIPQIVKFYKEVFNLDIDTSIKLPAYNPVFPKLSFIDSRVTAQMAIDAYKKQFGTNSVWANDYSKDTQAQIKEQQNRQEGTYFFAHTGTVEPDTTHLNKSYDDFHNDGNSYMIPLEGIMFALQYRFETGNMLDVKGVTRFHAIDTGGDVLCMDHLSDGQFHLGWSRRDDRHAGRGPRQVNF